MRINSLQNTPATNKPISFKSWERTVMKETAPKILPKNLWGITYLPDEYVQHRNNTYFFRDGNYIPVQLDFVVDFFKRKKTVNIYSWGCSNGTEAYTMLMYLNSNYPKQAGKFKFIARDYDLTAILEAKKGRFLIDEDEYERIQKYTNGQFDRYFKNTDKIINIDNFPVECEANPQYYNQIEFSLGNIVDNYKDMPKKNTYITSMNFMPYLTSSQRMKLSYDIANHMESPCCWGFGEYDLYNTGITGYLGHYGFDEKHLHKGLVYKKTGFLKSIFQSKR